MGYILYELGFVRNGILSKIIKVWAPTKESAVEFAISTFSGKILKPSEVEIDEEPGEKTRSLLEIGKPFLVDNLNFQWRK
jgi:hypothetical protein